MQAQQYQEALEQFQRYQEGGPPLSTSFMNAGICLNRLDREAEAILQFESALKIDPNFAPAMRLLALIHRKAERMEESERWEERLRKTQPGGAG